MFLVITYAMPLKEVRSFYKIIIIIIIIMMMSWTTNPSSTGSVAGKA